MPQMGKVSRHTHLLVASLMLAVAALHSYPLIRDSGDHLPGLGLADNVAFVWNLWWMRQAPAVHEPFFSTTAMMAPMGADLVLHTHTASQGLIASTLFRPLSVVRAQRL